MLAEKFQTMFVPFPVLSPEWQEVLALHTASFWCMGSCCPEKRLRTDIDENKRGDSPAVMLQWAPWLSWKMQDFWQKRKGKLYFADWVWNSSSWWLLFFCCCCCYPCGATNLQGQKRGTRAFRTLRVFCLTFKGPLRILTTKKLYLQVLLGAAGLIASATITKKMHKAVMTKGVKMEDL